MFSLTTLATWRAPQKVFQAGARAVSEKDYNVWITGLRNNPRGRRKRLILAICRRSELACDRLRSSRKAEAAVLSDTPHSQGCCRFAPDREQAHSYSLRRVADPQATLIKCRSALARECGGSFSAAVSGEMRSRASLLLRPATVRLVADSQETLIKCRSALAREGGESCCAAASGETLSRASALLQTALRNGCHVQQPGAVAHPVIPHVHHSSSPVTNISKRY